MDALVLAGGAAPPELAAATGCTDRALIEIGGQTMLGRVLAALRATPGVERIAVVGNPAALGLDIEAVREAMHVAAGGRMVDNLTRGMEALCLEAASPRVLVCTCDIPLVTPAALQELMAEARRRDLELAYPIVSRAVCEAAFPGGRRTFAPLRDGEFTGGNAVIVPGHIIGRVGALVDAAYNARKNPLALARILGPAFLGKFLGKRLAVAEIERKATQVLGCRAGAVEMRDATIAFDVDKPDDLRVAARALEKLESR